MRRKVFAAVSMSSAVLMMSVIGCAGGDPGTAADQLTTFVADFLRQLLAAFLL